MNKLVKGSIAGAAGIALLLGGAGSLALWNSDADLDSTTISSGTLAIDVNGAATAKFANNAPVDATSVIVPGDVITITQGVTIDASGDNLQADLSVDTTSLVDVADAVDELGDYVSFSYQAFAGATEVVTLTGMSGTTAESITSVVVTATFAADNEDAQGMSLDLDGLKVLLQQV